MIIRIALIVFYRHCPFTWGRKARLEKILQESLDKNSFFVAFHF